MHLIQFISAESDCRISVSLHMVMVLGKIQEMRILLLLLAREKYKRDAYRILEKASRFSLSVHSSSAPEA